MFTSWKLGRVAGIDLYLHPTFVIVPLIALNHSGGMGVVIALAVFACVLLHEFGHALMARRYGIATADITLYPIGGVARLERMPRSPGPELLVALAGPAVNLAIAAWLWAVLELFGPALDNGLGMLLTDLMIINVGLLMFNMLPVFPMDGGRVLRAGLSGWLGRTRATEIAAGLGRTVAAVAGVWFLLHGLDYLPQVALCAFVFFAASSELMQARRDERRRLADDDWPAPPPGYRWVNGGDGVYRLAPIVLTWGSQARGRRG